jgi:hypothetical protein
VPFHRFGNGHVGELPAGTFPGRHGGPAFVSGVDGSAGGVWRGGLAAPASCQLSAVALVALGSLGSGLSSLCGSRQRFAAQRDAVDAPGRGRRLLHAAEVDAPLIDKFRLWLNRFFWIFVAAAGVSTGLLVTGQLYDTTGFAAGAITASSLLAAWYAARYAGGDLRALAYWAVLAAVPVLANTRTGMVAVALTLPLTLAPLSTEKTPDCGGGAGGGGPAGFSAGARPEQDVLFGPGHLVGCGDRCA